MADSVGGGFAQGLAGGIGLSARGREMADQKAFQQAKMNLEGDQIAAQERREQIKMIRDDFGAIKTQLIENAKAVGPAAAAKILASPNMQAALDGIANRFAGTGVRIDAPQLLAELQGAASLAPDPKAVQQVATDNAVAQERAVGAVQNDLAVKKAEALAPIEVKTAGAVARAQEAAKPFVPQSKEGQMVYDRNKLVKVFGEGSEDVKRFDRLSEAAEKPALKESDISTLRGDFSKAVAEPVKALTAYDRIVSASSEGTAAGDIALVYGFMKMLDPASTVNSGEFATAANAGGIPDKVRSVYNSIVSGETLAPEIRKDFLGTADRLARPMRTILTASIKEYTDLAKRKGVDPRDIVTGINALDGDAILQKELDGK